MTFTLEDRANGVTRSSSAKMVIAERLYVNMQNGRKLKGYESKLGKNSEVKCLHAGVHLSRVTVTYCIGGVASNRSSTSYHTTQLTGEYNESKIQRSSYGREAD